MLKGWGKSLCSNVCGHASSQADANVKRPKFSYRFADGVHIVPDVLLLLEIRRHLRPLLAGHVVLIQQSRVSAW